MVRRIVIVGKGGSGKDHLRKELEKHGLKYCVSHSTRPPRDGEEDGIDYHFIGQREANMMKNRDEFYESVVFNEWIYGTSIREFYASNLFIMTPSGLSKMKKGDRERSFVVYLDIEEDVRKERLLKRNDADNVVRRLNADHADFLDFTDYDYSITNPFFQNCEDIIEISKINF
jgi:guanylate kinase